MAGFDIGGFFGGAGSGALSGFAVGGPLGAGIGGLLGGLGGGLGGGETPVYEPTPLQEEMVKYGQTQLTADKSTKKRIRSEAQALARSGGPGAAEAFLKQYVDSYSNPQFINKQLTKSYKKDIDYGSPTYWNLADQLYKQQGIGFTGDEYGGFVEAAKSRGIRSPQAFADMVKQQMIVEGKVPTPQQEMLGLMFGGIRRDESGRVSNLYPQLDMRLGLTPTRSTSTSTTTINI